MLTKPQVIALLGRPLSSNEDTNFDLYLDIAIRRLESLLGISLATTAGDRTFPSRPGFRTVYVDPFSAVTAVKVNGVAFTSGWVKKQGDAYNGTWFDSLEFDDPLHGERVEVSATWGFGTTTPGDLTLLLAALFGAHAASLSKSNVASKRIEDYSVTYRDTAAVDDVVAAHISTVRKYARVNGTVQHGRV